MTQNQIVIGQHSASPSGGTKEAWVLCAGKSTRCPNKLTEKFFGRTLTDYAVEFAIENGYTPHVLTTQRFPGTAGCLDGRTGLVLFGDNYYRGHIPQPSVACYTCSYRQSYGLAVVVGNKIVEKPHAFHGVNLCFTGYCFVDRWAPINKSIRGEFEITDLLNKISARAIPLNCDWEHYSIPDDYERVRSYVDVSQSR